jgi:4-amino-4-deoxy-L-arabinose transferase-like glycosyltransferase
MMAAPTWREPARLRIAAAALCALLVVIFSWQLWLHATSTSATLDEPVHLLAGHRYLQCGDYAFNPEHPPLLKALAAMPLQGMDLRMPSGLPCNPGFISKPRQFQLAAEFMADNGGDRVLLRARMGASLLGVVLALLACLASWRMFGPWPAVATMALFAMEPVLVAHGSLVTTDMAITVTMMLVVVVLYEARGWHAWARVLAMGLGFGLMLASKHSALLVLPLLAGLRMVDASLSRTGPWTARDCLLKPFVELCIAGAIALLVLWSFYGFRYSATPGAVSTVDLGGFLARVGRPGSQELGIAKLLAWLGATGLLPEAYLMGLTDIVGTSVRYTRVLGRSYSEGQWFFYPIALSVKSSVALLVLLPVGVVAILRDRTLRRQALFLLLPAVGYLAIAMSSKFTTGIRHVLQVYPFFILLAGFGLAWLWRRGAIWKAALGVLLAYQAATVTRAAPDYIPFANAFWGGPARAYDVLTFDNVEWGQSLKRIHADVARNATRECWIAGVGDPDLFADLRPCKRLPEGRLWRNRLGTVEAVPERINGALYLGARMVVPREGEAYRQFPAAGGELLANAVFVFRGTFDVPAIAGLSEAIVADQAGLEQRVQDALDHAARATVLAPGDPRTWISYGDALMSAGRTVEAREAAERASRALRKQPDYAYFASNRLADLQDRLAGQR